MELAERIFISDIKFAVGLAKIANIIDDEQWKIDVIEYDDSMDYIRCIFYVDFEQKERVIVIIKNITKDEVNIICNPEINKYEDCVSVIKHIKKYLQ